MQYRHRLIIFFLFIFSALALGLNARQPLTAVSDTDFPVAIAAPISPNALISFDANATPKEIDTRVLGTNLPNWIGEDWSGNDWTENETAIARTQAASPTIIRIPGGSKSNTYDWLACENEEPKPACGVWKLRPTEFADFIQTVNAEIMYTVNQNGTSQEAAALVAFFNGSVSDDTAIGVDVHGKNWYTVAHWAELRTAHGNPNPINVKYWEIGNEIWGGKKNMGTDCTFEWGWEEVWTCDGMEYVDGIGGTTEGYIDFRDAMLAVDSTIMVGAVGVSPQESWNNWGNEVLDYAGDVMDFYVIHKYAYHLPPSSREEALAQPQAIWEPMMDEYETRYEHFWPGESPPPVAVTEYNLFSVQDEDDGRWMTQAVNMLYMADSVGQMMDHGFAMANQWNLSNGQAGNGTDYGMLGRYDFARSPQYYVFPLWSRFGDNMLPVTSTYDPATTLSVYAGRIDPSTVSLLVINKTGGGISAPIHIDNMPPMTLGGEVDVAQSSSLSSSTATFNGTSNPPDDLPTKQLAVFVNGSPYYFPPYSITLLRLGFDEFIPTDFFYFPIVSR